MDKQERTFVRILIGGMGVSIATASAGMIFSAIIAIRNPNPFPIPRHDIEKRSKIEQDIHRLQEEQSKYLNPHRFNLDYYFSANFEEELKKSSELEIVIKEAQGELRKVEQEPNYANYFAFEKTERDKLTKRMEYSVRVGFAGSLISAATALIYGVKKFGLKMPLSK